MSALEYPYDKDAKCPTFDQFMKDITVNRLGLAKVMLQFMGYAFSGEKCRLAKALIMYGGGANGKSTLMNIMKRAAGQRAYSSLSLPELQSEQNRYELIGKFFNMSEETPNRKALDSSTFKNLVSGGEFMIKVVYKTPFKHKNKTKIVLACNELPEIEDNTHGMFRRLLIVPFDACFTGKEVFDMEDKLERELPGIFNLIIDGYQQLLANGGFVIPKEVEDEVSNYRLHSDDVYYYINKHITLQPFGDRSITLNKTTFEDLYDKYSSFAEMKMHKRPVKFRNFRTTIERIMPKERIINDQIWGIEYPNQGTF
jgi:putative DNA primase/helicase